MNPLSAGRRLTSLFYPQDLKDFMRQVGEVTYADAHKTRRNEGWVMYRLWITIIRRVVKMPVVFNFAQSRFFLMKTPFLGVKDGQYGFF